MNGHVAGVLFPTASPVVMSVARTFWEKATAAHVYCAQGRIRSERYARHRHDLAAISRSGAAREALAADYASMLVDRLMVGNALPFDELMQACAEITAHVNAIAGRQ